MSSSSLPELTLSLTYGALSSSPASSSDSSSTSTLLASLASSSTSILDDLCSCVSSSSSSLTLSTSDSCNSNSNACASPLELALSSSSSASTSSPTSSFSTPLAVSVVERKVKAEQIIVGMEGKDQKMKASPPSSARRALKRPTVVDLKSVRKMEEQQEQIDKFLEVRQEIQNRRTKRQTLPVKDKRTKEEQALFELIEQPSAAPTENALPQQQQPSNSQSSTSNTNTNTNTDNSSSIAIA
eukprot:TRINITY_DN4997_c0_g1_i1.p1 TRINITY_DN4997_c0_g1~~TRINITY_DN4997_c0_g1_i1.p1  ORF type:complete len:241 (+),score=87.12 TRINITY_DN4997_c0_g1_i1:221-943(+)